MRPINYKYIMLVIALIGGLMGCEKSLDINSDPNKATVSRPDLLLTTSQLYIGSAMDTRINEVAAVWCQYYTGGPGVSLGDWDKNTMATQDANNMWQYLYRSMSNLNYIIKLQQADTKITDFNNYAAIAKILTAYNTQVAVDLFGDVPFTDALKGDLKDGFIISPKYDNAKDVVYPGIATMLEDAKKLIALADASSLAPGGDDLIYKGDMTKWVKFANSLLLKIYVRSSNTTGVTGLAGLDFIVTNDDNAKIDYPGDAKGKNPLWTDNKSASLGNWFVGSKTTIDYLTGSADPRIDNLFDKTAAGTHNGLKQGDVENSPPTADYSRPAGAKATNGGLIFSPTAPVFLMSSWEVNFLLAEVAARAGGDAKPYYDAGAWQNAAYLGTDTAAFANYLNNSGAFVPGALNKQIKSIALQKWASMDGTQPIESWIETRRFDNAANPIFASPGGRFVAPTNNVLGGNIHPSIMFYPASEDDLNKSFPGQHVLTDKVFWDN